jgi:hypothetical protein
MNIDYTQYYNDKTSTFFEDVYYQGISEYDWHIVQIQLQKEEQYYMWCVDNLEIQIQMEKNLDNQIAQELGLGKSPNRKKAKKHSTFTQKEDQAIVNHVILYGTNRWSLCALKLPKRNGKQCRERYIHHLDPTISKEPWSHLEDALLVDLYNIHGKRWSLISRSFPGRTDNDIKNRYNTKNKRKINNTYNKH